MFVGHGLVTTKKTLCLPLLSYSETEELGRNYAYGSTCSVTHIACGCSAPGSIGHCLASDAGRRISRLKGRQMDALSNV